MLTTDHLFDGSPIWSDLGIDPGEGFAAGFARVAPWYRRALAGT